MAIGLDIAIEQSGENYILRLDGRVDAITTPALEREISSLFDAGHHTVLLDFEKVDYLSSAGMRLLLASTKRFMAKKGRFALFQIGDEVQEILKMAGFERVLAIYLNEADAIKG
ncbi:MAG: STAS domain-containing protein [Verrucomicrobia bacterium]|nr:STAS domain-containing protein [Verrucomicrobiota bacterium]